MQADDNPAPVLPGDLRIAFAPSLRTDLDIERVLVTGISDYGATCILVSLDYESATHRDIVLDASSSGLGYGAVVHTSAVCRIPLSRLSQPLGRVDQTVLDEAISCQFGDPSDQFLHGDYLIPSLDPREPVLISRIRNFRDNFGLTIDSGDLSPELQEDLEQFKLNADNFCRAVISGVGVIEAREKLSDHMDFVAVVASHQVDLIDVATSRGIEMYQSGQSLKAGSS